MSKGKHALQQLTGQPKLHSIETITTAVNAAFVALKNNTTSSEEVGISAAVLLVSLFREAEKEMGIPAEALAAEAINHARHFKMKLVKLS